MKNIKARYKVRYETFGGIIAINEPAAQIYVDKEFMKNIGYMDSELWSTSNSHLSAPCEVHFSITNACPLRCPHCYADGGNPTDSELKPEQLLSVIDKFANMGVFQVAFGGGEPFSRPDLFEIVQYTKERGITPNITTNGFYIDEKVAKMCDVFGQINVSVDGISGDEIDLRGKDSFDAADKAIKLLVKNRARVGLNVVISSANFSHLTDICAYAKANKISDVLILRYKPLGRVENGYGNLKLTAQHLRELIPYLKFLRRRFGIDFKLDCSLFPSFAYHMPDPVDIDFWGLSGCDAGNNLVSINPQGTYRACSFCFDDGGNVFNLEEEWGTSPHLSSFRAWAEQAPEPCDVCRYLGICKGGCHPIAYVETGSFGNADPFCPIVDGYRHKKIHRALTY